MIFNNGFKNMKYLVEEQWVSTIPKPTPVNKQNSWLWIINYNYIHIISIDVKNKDDGRKINKILRKFTKQKKENTDAKLF